MRFRRVNIKGVSAMMANLQNFIQTVSRMQWSDYLDILVVALLIYSLLPLLRTPNVLKIVRTVGAFVLVAWLTGVMELYTINWILSRLLSIGLLAFVILFQPEIRSVLEKVGDTPIRSIKSISENRDTALILTMIDQVTSAVSDFSASKTGALIVFERNTRLGDVIATVAEATGEEYKDGAHLHFEILKNGTSVVPTGYLTLEEK